MHIFILVSTLESYSLDLLCEILCHYTSFFLLLFMFPCIKEKNICEAINMMFKTSIV